MVFAGMRKRAPQFVIRSVEVSDRIQDTWIQAIKVSNDLADYHDSCWVEFISVGEDCDYSCSRLKKCVE